MPPTEFEASDLPQTHALDRAATGISLSTHKDSIFKFFSTRRAINLH